MLSPQHITKGTGVALAVAALAAPAASAMPIQGPVFVPSPGQAGRNEHPPRSGAPHRRTGEQPGCSDSRTGWAAHRTPGEGA